MVMGKLFQTAGLLKKFFFPLWFFQPLQAATYRGKKQEKNATPLKAVE
jgi:hypothetical protein